MNLCDSFIFVSWEALSFVFAVLPGIVAIAYCYECGKDNKSPKISGYFNMLKLAWKAKSEAYKKTADALVPASKFKHGSTLLAWMFIFIVALVGPGLVITAIALLLSIPATIISYYMGKRA